MNGSTVDFKPVPTRAALALEKQNKSAEFKALVFEEPKGIIAGQRKSNSSEDGTADRNKNSNKHKNTDDLEFDIKKARNEVLKFAINNQRQIKNKKKMEIFQAVKLGAKAPKKVCKNYKELQDERKRLKKIREERLKFHQLGKNQTGAASVKCRSKSRLEKQQKKRAPVSSIDQHYGVAKPKLKKRKQ